MLLRQFTASGRDRGAAGLRARGCRRGGRHPCALPCARTKRSAASRSFATPKSSNCCANIPPRSCGSPGLSQQNIRIVLINDRTYQRLRGRWPPHLRQRRRADRIRRRQIRSSACWRTKPATSPAATSPSSARNLPTSKARCCSRCCSALARRSLAGAAAMRPRRRSWRRNRSRCDRCCPISASRKNRPTAPA